MEVGELYGFAATVMDWRRSCCSKNKGKPLRNCREEVKDKERKGGKNPREAHSCSFCAQQEDPHFSPLW